jgi:glutathione S-transferase
MLLYDSANPSPNPRRVRIFLAEKGLSVPTRQVEILKGEHKSADFLAVNPMGQIPALVLDDGQVITESVAICRYFECLHPEPPMFGTDAHGIAAVDQALRRVELRLGHPLAQVWLHTHPLTARAVKPQYRDYGESQRPRVLSAMREFDRALANREWLDGKNYSMADIVLLTTVDFASFIGIVIPQELGALRDWRTRALARPSSQA